MCLLNQKANRHGHAKFGIIGSKVNLLNKFIRSTKVLQQKINGGGLGADMQTEVTGQKSALATKPLAQRDTGALVN